MPSDPFSIPAEPLDALLDPAHPRKAAAADWSRAVLGDAPDHFDTTRWKTAAAAGVLGLVAPIAHGGTEQSLTEALLTFEGLGLGSSDNGLIFALSTQVFAMQRALAAAGSLEQQSGWFPRLLDGSAIGSFAMSEPGAGSDTTTLATVADRTDAGYRLSGRKSWVSLGPLCDVVIVFAATDPSKGRWGLSAFLVDTSLPGVERGPAIERMGLRGAPFGDISFDGVELADTDRLGREGAGGSIFSAAVEAERSFLYAAQLGATERLLATAVERASTREQGGFPIGRHQAISHRLADMKLQLETSRLLVYKAAVLADRNESVTMAAALAKLQTSESAVGSALDAIRVFGAEGYTVEAGVEAELRHAIGGLGYAGTSDIQRNVVARLLGVDRPRPGTA